MSNYIFTRAENNNEVKQLSKLFNEVFNPEKVGDLAETLTFHFPGMGSRNWFVAKETDTKEIVSGFALIPWQWQFKNVRLKAAEMGIVGTLKEHRGKGLMKRINEQFDNELSNENYDLAVIQGIPGFYHRLGYHYALPMEHHTEVPIFAIRELSNTPIRKAGLKDIPFLLSEGNRSSLKYDITSQRTAKQWQYILTESLSTEYASEVFIVEYKGEQYFLRFLKQGFGEGLIITECSHTMPNDLLEAVFSFLKQQALERNKPYIRLNLPNDHQLVQHAIQYGAVLKPSYAWQIKLVNPVKFISKIGSLLENRIAESVYSGLSGVVTLDCYSFKIHLKWNDGILTKVTGDNQTTDYLMSIPEDLLTPFLLGFRSWQEMQYIRPDIFPADQYLRMDCKKPSEETGQLMDVLFPKLNNWIYGQY